MRIVSLLPSATEIVCALGRAESIVAVSHECDYPPELVSRLPVATASAIPPGLTSAEIDALVTQLLREGKGLYTLDADLIRELAPDLILTQQVCSVCAVDYNQTCSVAASLNCPAQVVSLCADSIEGVFADIFAVAQAIGVVEQAETLVANLRARLRRVQQGVPRLRRPPRVCVLEWLDPPFVAGHWVPEMIAIAGGQDVLGVPGKPSFRVTWDCIVAAQPEVILMVPCGYTAEQARQEWEQLPKPAKWAEVPAVRAGQVFFLEANAYFSRPGPRLVDGVEQIAPLLAGGRQTQLPVHQGAW